MKKIYNVKIDGNAYRNNQLSSEAFEISENTERIYVGSEKKDITLNLNIVKDFDLQDKTLYRYPKLSLPRDKVSLLKEKYNVKISRSIDNADLCVISEKYLTSLGNHNYSLNMPFKEFFNFLKHLIENNLITSAAYEKLKSNVELMDKDSIVLLNVRYYLEFFEKNNLVNFFQNPPYYYYWISTSEVNNIKKLNQNKFVYDTDILNIIDSELATLSTDQYEDIANMIKSQDMDNKSLALEMLSNCNIEQSFELVSFLFYWYYNELRYANNWNSINAKSLRARLSGYENSAGTNYISTYNRFIMLLHKENKLTKWNINQTKKLLVEKFLNSYIGGSAQVFNINPDDITIKSEYQLSNTI
jgi:hypothetical protein